MVRNQRPFHIDINETIRLRHEAAGLLLRLEANQRANEQVCAEIGKRDAMRCITGRSAIERAIETTRGMIRDMDHLLSRFAEDSDDADGRFTSIEVEQAHSAQQAGQLVESR
jgi:hypothetical protein